MRSLFIPFVLFSVLASAQPPQTTFDAIISGKLVGQSPGGVVLVSRQGRIVYEKAYGVASLELGTPMDVNHVFRIGSITKQFTASAVLKLAAAGKLSLQDSVSKFIKNYPASGAAITIEQLLAHTSGTKNLTNLAVWTPELMRRDLSTSDVIELFKGEPLDFEPDTQFRYSNSGYILLGAVIESVSGMNYAQYIRDNFFGPANMTHSHYDSSSSIVEHRTPGYQRIDGYYQNAQYINMSLPFGAGGLMSTAGDLLKWNEALLHGSMITPAQLEMAHSDHRLKNGKSTGYGYGWELGNVQGSPSVKHAGRINGAVTFALCLPKEDIFVVILTNCDCVGDLETPASMMAGLVMGKPYQYSTISLPEQALQDYQGIYNFDGMASKYISFEGGRLLYYEKGGMKRTLSPIAKDEFHLEDELTVIQFQRNEQRSITGMIFKGTGIPATGMRSSESLQQIKVINVKASALTKYVGDYQFSPGPVFSITQEEGRIFGAVGTDKKEILCYANNSFIAKDLDARIIFDVDKRGIVVGLRKIQSDEMKAVKIR